MMRGAIGSAWARPLLFAAVRISPSLARRFAARAAQSGVVDQIVAMRRPPVWKIDPAPGAVKTWRGLLDRGGGKSGA